MTKSAICFHHVTFSYNSLPVLIDISFDIEKGEKIAIIGPNGGGKTTLLKLIMGLLTPKTGQVLLFNAPPKKQRQDIGYIPQRFAFDTQFPLSALDVVLMGALQKLSWTGMYPSKVKKHALDCLERVGLKHLHAGRFGDLSGGQVQRVLIARAMMGNPEIFLLDEATASIDPHAEQGIYDLLWELSAKKTLVMVTHELDAVIKDINRVFVVERTLTPLSSAEVCKHFTKGVYHKPLMEGGHE